MGQGKVRVAILGGGVGAMTAAFALTEIDKAGENYEITVHQLGWRLGGKCASGRNSDHGERIEEHGLHIWAGFYENAFTVMRCLLNALSQVPGQPIVTIDDVFKRQDQIFFAQSIEQQGLLSASDAQQWSPWPFWFEPDPDPSVFPGRDNLWASDHVMPSLQTLVVRALASLVYNWNYYMKDWPGDPQAETAAAIAGMAPHLQTRAARLHGWTAVNSNVHPLLALAHKAGEELESELPAVRDAAQESVIALLEAFLALVVAQLERHMSLREAAEEGVVRLVEAAIESIEQDLEGFSEGFYRALIVVNFGICIILGMLKNDCLQYGLQVLEKYDFREFLLRQNRWAGHSAVVTALYDYTFGYRAGERDQPRVSACTAVEGLLRLFLTYKGGFFFKAVTGMGDTVFVPMYQLLKHRGVTFKFFHKVTVLEPNDNGEIETIRVDRQVDLREAASDYAPFVCVNGRDCWPSTPDWRQIVDGEKFKREGIDFESFYGPQPPPAERLCLRRGQDFDKVVLGISVAALAEICQPLIQQSPAWADMVANLETTRTQALQLWVDQKVENLGGPFVVPLVPPVLPWVPTPVETMGPIATAFQPPFDTYSDMSQLLPAEAWPAPAPQSVGYFCAVMSDQEAPNDQTLATAKVRQNALGWMTTWLDALWTDIGGSDQFKWNMLHAPSDLTGSARLDVQYWRANINPSDRYVLSLPNTLQYRLSPGGSGYANLYLAGDWTRVPELNAGCVEVATMSGLAAASALSGVPIPVISYTQQTAATGNYVPYGGWNSLPPPPSSVKDCSCYTLLFRVDGAACQKFLDQSFNRVAGRSQFRILPLLPDFHVVSLMVLKSARVAPSDPPFSLEGTMDETDIGFWLPVEIYDDGAVLPSSVAWLPAYLFVDNSYTTASGREIWGFPKFVASANVPDAPPASGASFEASASAVIIEKFSPTSKASRQQLLSLQCPAMSVLPVIGSPIDTFKQLSAAADSARQNEILQMKDPLVSLPPGLLPLGLGELDVPMPVVFLKQFRAADGSAHACYQKIITGPLVMTALRDLSLVSGAWQLELSVSDSLPFIRDLGLGIATNGKVVLSTGLAFWCDIDFTVGLANPIN
jgi:uncharacterized protein with NAD-binding domain and iron-sulfur cluster